MYSNILKQSLGPILRAMIFFVVSLTASLYLVGKINDVSETIIERRATLSLYQNSQEQFAVLKEDFPKISNHIDKAENAFPSSENILPFINAVENLSGTSGVQQSFKFENIIPQFVPDLGLNTISFNIVLSGNKAQFLAYLYLLEKLPHFIKIE